MKVSAPFFSFHKTNTENTDKTYILKATDIANDILKTILVFLNCINIIITRFYGYTETACQFDLKRTSTFYIENFI